MSIEKQFLGQKNQNLESEEKQEKEQIVQVKEVIRKEGPHLATFAGDASLRYTPSLEAETFAFNHEGNEVIVPVKWFLDRDYSPEGMRWAFYHELSHFIDMRNDPKEYLDNFEYKKEGKANQDICSWLESKLKEDEVEQKKIDKLKEPKQQDKKGTVVINDLQAMAYQYLHTMYNVLDDISVNNLVMQKAPIYSGDDGQKEVEKIYKDKLGFGDPDFRGKPKHIQFIYSLIRDEMLPDAEESILDEEVDDIKNKKVYGKTVQQTVEDLKPKSGNLSDAGERYKKIRTFLEPIYLKLLKEDINNLDFKQMEEEAEKQKQESSRSEEEVQEQGEADEGENASDKEQSRESKDKNEEDEKQGKKGGEEEDDKNEGASGEKQSEESEDGEGSQGEEEGQEQGEGEAKSGQEGGEESNEGSESDGEEGEDGEGDSEGENKKKDKGEESKDKSSKEKGSHESGGGFDFNPFKDYHENPEDPDEVFTDADIEEMLEKFLEDKKEAERTPEERAKTNQEKLKAEFDKMYDISPETRELFEKRKEQIKKPRREMRKFWKRIIGKSVQLVRKKVRKQKRGDVNVEDFVERYPDIEEGTRSGKLDKLDIYERKSSEMENVNMPERIEVSLVADMSGSMDKFKIESLQKTISLLLLSLKDFNSYLDQSRRETKTKLSAYSEVYVFGDSFNRVKKFRDEYGAGKNKKNEAEIMKTFNYLQKTLGSTNVAAVLSEIINSVDDKQKRDIKKGKVRKIVFVVTDGQPNSETVEDTKNRVNDMLDKNIIHIAFQIGKVDKEEKTTFEYIWNKDRKNNDRDVQLGYHIGEDIDQLPDELMKSLKQKFGDIKL